MAAEESKVEAIFYAAMERDSFADRAGYLDEACAGDPELRSRVERLLGAQHKLGGFLENGDECGGANLQLRAQVEALLQTHDKPDSPPERPVLGDQQTQALDALTDRDGPGAPEGGGLDGGGQDVSLEFLDPCDTPGRLGMLGPYEVLKVIGRGGMGLVLKAHDPKLNRTVAIKTLAPELAANPTARKRFMREAQAAAAVSHPHVVTIHAVDEAGNTPYLVMECIDGVTLQDKIERVGTLELREILRIGSQTAAGLAAAHAQGLIHRDVKPGNILLENSVERVKVSDFGLARAVDDVSMTRTGEVAGTPQHMSPEQALGQPLDQRSDLFSLGSVLYAMCTGRSPFRAETAIATMRRVCDGTPRPILEINQDIPERMAAIIDKLLAKDPDDRFQTAGEVADLLGRYLAHLQHPASTPPPDVPGTRPPADATLAVAPRVEASRRPATRRGWPRRAVAVAATALLGICLSIAVTEATGVTNLAATVIRIAMGEGTLVIEVDDPTVQVSLDGEKLSITGAGIQELKLRPGEYQFQAIKDGQPVKTELISVTRGGRQVVRVTREAAGPHPPGEGAIKQAAEPGAFVVLRAEGAHVAKFDTLAEAVQGSAAGDTIEIRGNGPFITDQLYIKHPLVIRAGDGFRPLIKSNPKQVHDRWWAILVNRNPLVVLEGLDLESTCDQAYTNMVAAEGPIRMANCRLFVQRGLKLGGLQLGCIYCFDDAVLKNCLLIPQRKAAAGWQPRTPAPRFVVENCVFTDGLAISDGRSLTPSAELRQNTFLGYGAIGYTLIREPSGQDAKFQITAVRNVFEASRYPLGLSYAVDLGRALNSVEAKALFLRALHWQEDSNLYLASDPFLRMTGPDVGKAVFEIADLAGWHRFWGLENTGSTVGVIRFQGGNLLARAKSHPEQLTPEDFRLQPDSAGYRAGPDGKDLGADVDLVGPGEAYERWKKTPEYQQWQQETRELMEAAVADQPKAEAGSETETAEERKATSDNEFTVLPNGWVIGEPVNLGPTVNSSALDGGPALSPDGLTLFFVSDRQGGQGKWDLWMSTRAALNAPWGEPVNLGPTVNSSSPEFSPALSPDGLTLFFSASRSGGQGEVDLCMSTRAALSAPWGEPVNLGPTVNSSAKDADPALSPDGLTLFFASGRQDGQGGWDVMDLCMSTRAALSSPWGEPVNLGPTVNSSVSNTGPALSPDGLTLFFASCRQGGFDLWMSTRAALNAPWGEPVNLGPTVNSSSSPEFSPALSPDGLTLFFDSDRPGGQGGRDLWMARIEQRARKAEPGEPVTDPEKPDEKGNETGGQEAEEVEPAEPAADP